MKGLPLRILLRPSLMLSFALLAAKVEAPAVKKATTKRKLRERGLY